MMLHSFRCRRSALHAGVLGSLLVASGMPFASAATSGADEPPLQATDSARRFLSALSDRQQDSARFSMDDPERTTWAYIPKERGGLPLKAMDRDQRAAAFGLLDVGLSTRGVALAHAIIALEGTLRVLEEAAASPWAALRDPELFYLAVFGEPAAEEPWGWRFEGHHLSVNVSHLPHVSVVAPLFMGANPARVPSGPQAGLRVLAAEEDLGFELLDMLDAEQRARATVAEQTTGDILTRSDPAVGPMAFTGLPASAMTAAQQGALRRLLQVYAGRMADDAARAQLERIEQAGFGELHFAWAGSHRPGEPHYYRIHGPTVLVEYDNTQSNANHIHTVWRDLENDFGGDLLRRHYGRQNHRE
jgi:hypothetical protein